MDNIQQILIFTLVFIHIVTPSTTNKHTIQIDAMTITQKSMESGTGIGGYVTAAQYLALESINNDSSLLNDYIFALKIYNTQNNNKRTIEQAIEISDIDTLSLSNSDKLSFRVPIMLGTPSSTLSILTNPILGAFDWSQISSYSTSTQLSEIQYSTFYRTVPSDNIQAKTIVWLCETFNWTNIIILYYGNSYGIYLANEIHELVASKKHIKIHSISYIGNKESITNAAITIKQISVYIIILIPSVRS
eukprot:71152_1